MIFILIVGYVCYITITGDRSQHSEVALFNLYCMLQQVIVHSHLDAVYTSALRMGNLSCNTHNNLCITFVIADTFAEIITRSGVILFILQPKIREPKKQTIRNEWKHEKTTARSTIIHGRPQKFFHRGATSTFCLSFSNFPTISVPSKIILRWANICFSEHDYFRAE